jgi:alkylated DNA repair protein (DNA oxidative demethylase)
MLSPDPIFTTLGDVVVLGGPSRLANHGVVALADGNHSLLRRRRLNLTFRRMG